MINLEAGILDDDISITAGDRHQFGVGGGGIIKMFHNQRQGWNT